MSPAPATSDCRPRLLQAARAEDMRPFLAMIAAAGATLFAFLAPRVGVLMHFAPDLSSGVVGWAAWNKYPIRQDVRFFALAMVGLPATILAAWTCWITASWICARIARISPAMALRQNALAALWTLLLWPDTPRLEKNLWAALKVPALFVAGSGLLLLAFSFALRRALRDRSAPPCVSGGTEDPGEAPATTPPPQTPLVPRRRLWLRLLAKSARTLYALIVLLAIPCSIYLLAWNSNLNGAVDLFHEGERLVPAGELLRGAVPYRDIYLQHGLFQNALIPFLGMRLSGPSVESVRFIEHLVAPLAFVAFYLVGLSVFRIGPVSSLLLVLVLFAEPDWAQPRAIFGLLAIGVLARAVAGKRGFRLLDDADTIGGDRLCWRDAGRACWMRGKFLFLSGCLAGLAFWHHLDAGLYTLFAASLLLLAAGLAQRRIALWRRPLPLLCFGFGAATISLPLLGYFLWHGALDDVARNAYIQSAYHLDTWGLPFPSFFPLLNTLNGPDWTDGFGAFLRHGSFQWYLPILVLLAANGYLTYRLLSAGFWASTGAVRLLALFLLGAGFFRTSLGRSDAPHLYPGLAMALVLVLFILERGLGRFWHRLTARRVWWPRRLAGLAVCAWIFPALWLAASHVQEHHRPLERFRGRWAGLKSNPFVRQEQPEPIERAGRIDISGQADHLRRVVDYIRANVPPGEPIFDFSSQAGYLFFADRPSATRYFQIAYASPPSAQQEVVHDLERRNVQFVIFRAGGFFDCIDGVPAEKRHAIVAQYLQDHFAPVERIGETVFLKRKQ